MRHSVAKNEINELIEKECLPIWHSSKVCFNRAAKTLLYGLFQQGSPLVKRLAVHITENDTSLKGKQERVSGWLKRYDFSTGVNHWLLKENAKHITADTCINIDLSDLSKAWGGSGMEGMEQGRDGSTKRILMGHTIGSAVIPGKRVTDSVRPLLFTLMSGRKDPIGRIQWLCDTVMEATNGKGILVLDREADCQALIQHFQSKGYKFIIRIKMITREVFEGSKATPESLPNTPGLWKKEGKLNTYGAPLTILKWNTILSDNSLHSLYLYTNIDNLLEAPSHYKRRWAIETFFKDIKQLFNLESVCVRTLTRLNNLVSLTVLTYHFILYKLREHTLFPRLLRSIHTHLHKTIHSKEQFRLFIITARDFLNHIPHAGGRPKKRELTDNFLATLGFS